VALKKELAFNLVKVAFRQSFLFSLFIVFLLILKSQHLFNWINLLLLVIIFAILELFLTSYQKNH
jgi:diacylglycerol kinase